MKVKLCLFIAMAIISIVAACLIPASIATNSRNTKRELPIYNVETDNKQVALTFDAAWGNEDTSQILSILDKYNVKATFFMTGGWVTAYPDDVKAIYKAGHDLGNHSQNHLNMSKLSSQRIEEEIMFVHDQVYELTKFDMCLFRPPYGDYDDMVITECAACGYYAIQWSVDSLDWKDYGAENIVDTVLKHKNLNNGAIILLHNGAKYTSAALEDIIVGLQEMGYEIVPVSQLIYTDNYEINSDGCQIKVQ